MPGDFAERMSHLSREVGYGLLRAECEVNQSYAQDQHETVRYRHDDGRYQYLGKPLLENAFNLIEDLADSAITIQGSDIIGGMINISEKMSGYVLTNAPKLTGRLSTSGHPKVTDNGIVVYDRPPISARIET